MQFSELLQWLSTGVKTGTLIVRGAPGEKRIYFKEGKVVSSSSTVEREFLGRFLVGFGFITEEELLRALQVQQESKVLLGKILVMIGAIREEELADLLRLKAAETIYDVFLWDDGSFAFIDGEIPALSMVPMSTDVTGLVMEGLRRFDEWRRIRTRITSLGQVPQVLIPVEEGLNDREKMILGAVDGERTIEEIASVTHNPDFHVAKFVYDLLESGHLQIIGERPEPVMSHKRREAELHSEALITGTIPAVYGYVRSEPEMLQPVRATPVPPGAAPPPPEEKLPPAPPSLVEPAAPPPASWPGGRPTTPPGDVKRFLRRDSDSRTKRPSTPKVPVRVPARTSAEAELPEAVEALETPEGIPRIPLSAIPRLKKPMEELMAGSFTPNEAFIVSRINGLWDIRSIARISPFPEGEVLRVVAKLEAGGYIALK